MPKYLNSKGDKGFGEARAYFASFVVAANPSIVATVLIMSLAQESIIVGH